MYSSSLDLMQVALQSFEFPFFFNHTTNNSGYRNVCYRSLLCTGFFGTWRLLDTTDWASRDLCFSSHWSKEHMNWTVFIALKATMYFSALEDMRPCGFPTLAWSISQTQTVIHYGSSETMLIVQCNPSKILQNPFKCFRSGAVITGIGVGGSLRFVSEPNIMI